MVDPIDLFYLPMAKHFRRIQTPDAFQQTLSSQNFMQAGNATGELVGNVEECGIAIGHFHVSLEEPFGNGPSVVHHRVAFLQQFDGTFRPNRPVAQ